MIILSIIALLCFFMSGVFKGVSDTLADHYGSSIFYYLTPKWFWDKRISYLNKYKNRDPSKGSAFSFSTNVLVWLTDGWHLSNFCGHLFSFIGICVLPEKYLPIHKNWDIEWINIIYLGVIWYGMQGTGFTLTYNWLFKKTTWKTK